MALFDVIKAAAQRILKPNPARGSGPLGRNDVQVDSKESLLAFSAIYACTSGIAHDVAKLKINHKITASSGITSNANSPIQRLLTRPNRYQTQFQFFEQWVLSRLLTGNTYVLKDRVGNKIDALYILEPDFVTTLVADDGSVFYELKKDNLSGIGSTITVPAEEIIHDRHTCLFHPLMGVGPIYACGYSATMGNAISKTSAGFFQNNAQPGGILSAPGRISDETANRLKTDWQNRYSGRNAGSIAVLGDGLQFHRMTVSAQDSQLIEQLKFTIEDVARAFRYPLYKLGAGSPPISNNVEALNLEYYAGCLQPIIESMEDSLDAAFGFGENQFIEFDLDGLSRMDSQSVYKNIADGIKGGFLTPNEGRQELNLPPVAGGDGVFLQQQNYSTEDLAKLREREFAEPVETAEEQESEEQTRSFMERLRKGLC